MDIKIYAMELLKNCGCALDCYKGEYSRFALPDMQEYAKNNEVPFLLEDVAAALVEIGNEQPDPPRQGHKQFCMIFDVGHTVAGIESEDLEEAKFDAIQTLVNWVVEEQINWAVDKNGNPHPTPEQIESWNDMINTCSVYVAEWNDEKGRYDDSEDAQWFPSHEDENNAEWLEWEQLKEKHGW